MRLPGLEGEAFRSQPGWAGAPANKRANPVNKAFRGQRTWGQSQDRKKGGPSERPNDKYGLEAASEQKNQTFSQKLTALRLTYDPKGIFAHKHIAKVHTHIHLLLNSLSTRFSRESS